MGAVRRALSGSGGSRLVAAPTQANLDRLDRLAVAVRNEHLRRSKGYQSLTGSSPGGGPIAHLRTIPLNAAATSPANTSVRLAARVRTSPLTKSPR
jgi:hypothetical protein